MENIARRTINDAELDLLIISVEMITEDVSADEIAWRESIIQDEKKATDTALGNNESGERAKRLIKRSTTRTVLKRTAAKNPQSSSLVGVKCQEGKNDQWHQKLEEGKRKKV